MKVAGDIAVNGQSMHQAIEQPDPFWNMAVTAQQQNMPTAKIGCMTGDSIECVGPDGKKSWPKCSFTVEVHCAQTEQIMAHAAEHVHRVAVAYVNNAMLRMVPDYRPMQLEP